MRTACRHTTVVAMRSRPGVGDQPSPLDAPQRALHRSRGLEQARALPVPTTRKRRARLRPQKEWVTADAPDLAIVPRELWDAAQAWHRTISPWWPDQWEEAGPAPFRPPPLRHLWVEHEHRRRAQSVGEPRLQRSPPEGRCDLREPEADIGTAGQRDGAAGACGLRPVAQLPDLGRGGHGFRTRGALAQERRQGNAPDGRCPRPGSEKPESGGHTCGGWGTRSLRHALPRGGALRDLRRQLKDVSFAARCSCDPRPAASCEGVEDIEQLVQVDPAAARSRLARYLEPVVFTAVKEDGEIVYSAEITLKNETAALAGGRVIDGQSCGGRI
jgi:hypothetical protein